jgi:hypothetical protein
MRESLRLLDANEKIPFLCECNRRECYATVWLLGVDFDRIRERGAYARAASHASALAA